ncbi:uncharacterized protein MAM_05189 [Metarhizium album ARSEF 1941]|uniref:Proline-rich protein RiP-15 n=1 Tax=Metarhizium album (strain ARSEF 1941) TaxID=1081103 RepID=A0A0B2WVY9_METAS|nr:uncharacterized protein MAM_05189 [Metarhizium album ARSEF 1941]KHN97080.1 hypothetical protein MAM_05189 [Metarhizium album ARSEF 1941]
MSAPPPPPPHGEVPRSSGLPPGKYDIFVIPEHSAGAGFLYLPSLKPSVNSFFAGFASALILVALFQSMAPAFRAWWETFQGLGNMGITLLILGVGFGAWALGRTQKDTPRSNYHYQSSYSSGGGSASGTAPGGFGASSPGASPSGGAHARGHGGAPPPPPPHSSPPPPPPGGEGPSPQSRAQSPPPPPEPETPKASWQRPLSRSSPPRPNPPQPSTPQPQTPRGTWEKAREETRKKEEERKVKEAEQKRREEAANRLAELRAKEARERQERERERERKEKDVKDKKLKEEAEQRRKELAERLRREKEEKEKEKERQREKEKEEQKKKEAAAAEGATRVGSTYALSGGGEKTSMWPNGRPPVPPSTASARPPPTKNPPSPEKKPPAPTARTCVTTPDDDGYSYRPYDQQDRKSRRPSISSFTGSDASWAQSHTTARTSPPPSVRGPYTTKDPDKIVIQAVYLFMSQYSKTPASQLVSGVGSVTDGLILRITTEGLFIDDDVRGVPQREWDVKAWTLKLVEVWCPPHCLNGSAPATPSTPSGPKSAPHLLYKMATARRNAERDSQKVFNGDEADAYLAEMLRACKGCCRLGLCERTLKNTNVASSTGQTGAWKAKGLHVLRASVRDQEGKRYVFVMNETESWKLAFGLQRLRGGTQVRHLGVAGLTPSEARGTLEMLGWSG